MIEIYKVNYLKKAKITINLIFNRVNIFGVVISLNIYYNYY